MPVSRTHILVAVSIALGVVMAPRAASASQCECSTADASSSPPACETAAEIRCDTLEDCATILPFSRPARLDLARFDAAPVAQHAPRLSWCENADDPECAEADPERRPETRIAVAAACDLPDVLALASPDAGATRSTTQTEIVSSLAGIVPVHRLDRPPR